MAAFSHTLRHRVTIKARQVGKDGAGQPLTTFLELRKTWADVRSLGGLAAIKAGAATSKVQASIRLRWCEDVKAGMRVEHGAVTYNVLSVLPDANRVWVDAVCEAIQ
jgi:SPP1 family predicted phage head-tail adaptor